AFDRDVPPVDPDDAFNHSDVYLFTVENSALFDVQFEISGNVALLSPHFRQLRDISTDELYSFANRLAAAANKVELFLGQLTIHRTAANESAFFVLKNDDFEWVTSSYIVFRQSLCDLDRANRTNYAVVVSAFRNGIDV